MLSAYNIICVTLQSIYKQHQSWYSLSNKLSSSIMGTVGSIVFVSHTVSVEYYSIGVKQIV